MPRLPRICPEGAYHHVTCRGNNKERTFKKHQDYQRYLIYLAEYKKEFKFAIAAYCLMSNHVHLLIQSSQTASLSKIMQCLNSRYTQYFNKRYQRVGHLFQGRFSSKIVGDDVYLMAASRYIHRNPVKAGLCRTPVSYVWSSCKAYLDGFNPLKIVDVAPVLSLFAREAKLQQKEYRAFLESDSESKITWEEPGLEKKKRGRPAKATQTEPQPIAT